MEDPVIVLAKQGHLPAKTLELTTRIDRSDDPDEVFRLFEAFVRDLGFTAIAFGHVVNPARVRLDSPDYFGVHNWPDEWAEAWIEQDFIIHDPVIQYILKNPRPFVWSRAFEYATRFGKQVAEQGARFGLKDGIAIPIRTIDRPMGCVTLGGTQIDLSPEAFGCLEIASMHAYTRLETLLGAAPKSPALPDLSRRETEVLHWVAEGKSNWEISQILNLSENTVSKHVANAMGKLGAVSRAHAVTVGLRSGILLP